MIRVLVLSFLCSLICASVKAQLLGQTKAYIIKNYEVCRIQKNESDYLLMDCNGNEQLITFDEDGLSNFFGREVRIDDWNKYQTNVVWEGANCASRSVAPVMKSGILSDVIIYTVGKIDFYFFDCDFDGNKETDMKSMALKRRE